MTDPKPSFGRLARDWRVATAGVVLLVAGGAAGTVAGHALRPGIEMAPAQPVAIASLAQRSGVVTVRGQVAEVYGTHAVLTDASGRTLVELGRPGEEGSLVATGQTVTVQGRFRNGVLHGSFLIDAKGDVTLLAPFGPPRGPGLGRRGPRGPEMGGPDGPEMRGPGVAPPAVAPAPAPVAQPSGAATPMPTPAPTR